MYDTSGALFNGRTAPADGSVCYHLLASWQVWSVFRAWATPAIARRIFGRSGIGDTDTHAVCLISPPAAVLANRLVHATESPAKLLQVFPRDTHARYGKEMQHCWRSIGFPVDSMDDFKALGIRAAKSGISIETSSGSYIRWDSGDGAQIWVQIKHGTRAILGWHTHFAGRAQMRIAVTKRMLTMENDPLEGAFHGWVDPRSDDATEGQYPLLFHSPNFAMYDHLILPTIRTVQLTAFAQTLAVYEGDKDSAR